MAASQVSQESCDFHMKPVSTLPELVVGSSYLLVSPIPTLFLSLLNLVLKGLGPNYA